MIILNIMLRYIPMQVCTIFYLIDPSFVEKRDTIAFLLLSQSPVTNFGLEALKLLNYLAQYVHFTDNIILFCECELCKYVKYTRRFTY